MANRFKFKRSSVAAAIPAAGVGASQIDVGEIAINLVDEAVFFQNSAGTIVRMYSFGKTPVATTSVAGFMSASDKLQNDNFDKAQVNILDFGADNAGAVSIATSLTNAIAALPSGGVIYFPAGTYLLSAAFTIAQANITLRGATKAGTNILTSSQTVDMFIVNAASVSFQNMTFTGTGSAQVSTRTAGFAINANGGTGCSVTDCNFAYQYDCINVANSQMDVEGVECRYFAHSGIIVNHNSDHRLFRIIMDNLGSALPTGAGIDIVVSATTIIDKVDLMRCNFAINVSPLTGVTVPIVKITNSVLDTCAVGLRMAGAGFVYRVQCTNVSFVTMSTAGALMAPTTASGVDAITFVNCGFYSATLAGTGISVTTANVAKWKAMDCTIAGWVTGVGIVAGANHTFLLVGNTIGASGGFGVNTTGINVAAGAYKAMMILGNDLTNNTTAMTTGAVTSTGEQILMDNNLGLVNAPQPTAPNLLLSAAGTAIRAGSSVPFLPNTARVATKIRFTVLATNAATVNTNTITVRYGVNNTNADTAVLTLALGAGTAVVGGAKIVVEVDILTIGASGTLMASLQIFNNGATGFTNVVLQSMTTTAPVTINTTTSNFLGVYISPSAANVVTLRTADLEMLSQ